MFERNLVFYFFVSGQQALAVPVTKYKVYSILNILSEMYSLCFVSLYMYSVYYIILYKF